MNPGAAGTVVANFALGHSPGTRERYGRHAYTPKIRYPQFRLSGSCCTASKSSSWTQALWARWPTTPKSGSEAARCDRRCAGWWTQS